MNLTEKEMLEYNRMGLIPGPEENEQDFIKRAAYCLNLKSQIPQIMLAQELPFAAEEMQTSEEILKKGCEKAEHIYSIYPAWVPLFFTNYKLSFWQGGCAWIFQQKVDSPTSAFFQLRLKFLKSQKYLGIYDRNELITHELAHVGRMKFEEPKFEEILAYRSAKSSFRRYFGPIIQSSYESLIFVLALLALVAVDIFSISDGSGAFSHLSSILRIIIVGLIGFGIVRLWIRQRQFKACLKNLRKTLFNIHEADAVIYRLTDKEIIDFSRTTPEAIKNYADEQKNKDLRWNLIYEAYFKNKRPSDHYDGNKFHNNPPVNRSLKEVLTWMFTRKSKPWPKKIPDYPPAKPLRKTKDNELSVTFVNHSTLLIQWDGMNILTDPIWSERCSPFKHWGPKRVHAPGIRFEDLPPIDFVLISHNHYDHMDLPTLKLLKTRHDPSFVTGLGNRDYLEKRDFENVTELDWWQEMPLSNNISVVFTPAQHFSARHIFDTNKTLWGGFVLKKGNEIIYFAADTGYTHYFEEVKRRLGSPILSFLPIGAFEPRWFMKAAHTSPEEAVQAHLDLGSKKSVAIHFGTFHVSDEAIDDPEKFLKEGLKAHQIPEDHFIILKPGESL